VLFIDDTQVMPFNITAACHHLKGLTLMPTTGLNVYSMLKHSTVVITLKSLEKIEEKLLTKIHSTDFKSPNHKRN
jgi:large subunit ribosomal protein L4